MDRSLFESWLRIAATLRFARAGGAGGQNVNKVNTKVCLRFRLSEAEGLSDEEKALAAARLAARITEAGEITVQVQDERSQGRNRELAFGRAAALVAAAVVPRRRRRKTGPSAASKARRRVEKTRRAGIKRLRRGSGFEE